MKDGMKSIIDQMDGLYWQAVKKYKFLMKDKLNYPIVILEALQHLEMDLVHLAKYIELVDDAIAKKREGQEFNIEYSKIRARLLAEIDLPRISEGSDLFNDLENLVADENNADDKTV